MGKKEFDAFLAEWERCPGADSESENPPPHFNEDYDRFCIFPEGGVHPLLGENAKETCPFAEKGYMGSTVVVVCVAPFDDMRGLCLRDGREPDPPFLKRSPV